MSEQELRVTSAMRRDPVQRQYHRQLRDSNSFVSTTRIVSRIDKKSYQVSASPIHKRSDHRRFPSETASQSFFALCSRSAKLSPLDRRPLYPAKRTCRFVENAAQSLGAIRRRLRHVVSRRSVLVDDRGGKGGTG